MLSSRPLSSSTADQELLVDRARELDVLARAHRLSLSVAITGEPGVGTTTLLNAHADWLREDTADEVVVVRGAEAAEGASEFIRHVQAAAGVTFQRLSRAEEARLAAADLGRQRTERVSVQGPTGLGSLAEAVDGNATVLVDGPVTSTVLSQVFGRWRDELWEFHQLRWVVNVGWSGGLEAPADAFFDSVLRVESLPPGFASRLLQLRIGRLEGEEEADPQELARMRAGVDEIVEQSGGNPARLMSGLRTLALEPPWRSHRISQLLGRAKEMGGTHAMLVEAMAASPDEPVSASDTDLQDLLAVSRGRIATLLGDLEDEGLVERHQLRSDGPGRPRVGYHLVLREPETGGDEA